METAYNTTTFETIKAIAEQNGKNVIASEHTRTVAFEHQLIRYVVYVNQMEFLACEASTKDAGIIFRESSEPELIARLVEAMLL